MQLMNPIARSASVRTPRASVAIGAKSRVVCVPAPRRLQGRNFYSTAIFATEADEAAKATVAEEKVEELEVKVEAVDRPEVGAPEAEMEGSTEEDEEDAQLSALERAKLIASREVVDKVALEAALADMDAEIMKVQESVAEAESRAMTMETQNASLKDQLLRLNADFENFRRRTGEEKLTLQDSVRGDVVNNLLPVVDNFELARTSVKAETEGEIKINQSYQGLYKQFVEFLRSLGVEAIPTQGEQFDPELHEAIATETDNGVPENTVIAEFRKGFRLKDKLLRPAMVKVSKHDPEPVMSSEE